MRGLHDDLRQAVEQAARPRQRVRLGDDVRSHVGIQPALAAAIAAANGNDVVTGMEEFGDVKIRLCVPVVRLADILAVNEIPAFVVTAGEMNLHARAAQVFRQREMHAVNRRGVVSLDRAFAVSSFDDVP